MQSARGAGGSARAAAALAEGQEVPSLGVGPAGRAPARAAHLCPPRSPATRLRRRAGRRKGAAPGREGGPAGHWHGWWRRLAPERAGGRQRFRRSAPEDASGPRSSPLRGVSPEAPCICTRASPERGCHPGLIVLTGCMTWRLCSPALRSSAPRSDQRPSRIYTDSRFAPGGLRDRSLGHAAFHLSTVTIAP